MIVHAYRVTGGKDPIAFDDALAGIWNDDLRLHDHIRKFGIHLEERAIPEDCLSIAFDFVRPFDRDIGLLREGERSTPIQREAGQTFSNYTAALFYLPTQTLFLESNLAGARLGSINAYLDAFSGGDTSGYRLSPIDIEGHAAMVIKTAHIRAVELTVDLIKLEKMGALGGAFTGAIARWFEHLRSEVKAERTKIAFRLRPKKGDQKKGIHPVLGLESDEVCELVEYAENVMNHDPKAMSAVFFNAANTDITDQILTLNGNKWSFRKRINPHDTGILYPFKERVDVLECALAEAKRRDIL